MDQKREDKENIQVPEDSSRPDREAENEPVEEQSDLENNDSDEESVNDDWYEEQEFVADPKQTQIRLDKFLIDRLRNRSRSKVQNAIKAGSVKVDNQEVKPNYKVKPGNHISIVLPKGLESVHGVAPQEIPLDIIYEDTDVMVVNKPYKMAVHPGVGIPNGTLVNAVAWHLREQLDELPVKEGNDPDRAGIVHRIDKDTTGLMVVAKKEFAMAHLANQFFKHTIERRYWALVWGDMEEDSGTIVGNIGRNPNDRKLFMVFPEGEDGKYAVTHWRVLERFYYVTLIECQLETGRTHQIRVHLKSIGHTLFGDPRYGGNQILKGTLYSKYKQFAEKLLTILPRQALHAKVLGFEHPRTGEHVRFESDLPQDMQSVINKWRAYVHARKQLL
ncbi:MAG: RluA family pseudouridine synthase [Lewinellaceae bacterium]|nr:RluA family pseudouridine synthase [Saprospiraceae bacterium]MCB9314988.1 RluA family pseudouridine synthase [Lewinellaceae bacterium]MCB9329778.1 RluA family pseudouridine synthase [Lewinellaceae bacterium]